MMIPLRLTMSLFIATSLIGCGAVDRPANGESEKPAPPAERQLDPIKETGRAQEITFKDVGPGRLPTGWKVEATRPKGRLAEWIVQKEAGNEVLAVKINDYDRGTFNLFWADQLLFQDGTIQVRVKEGTGDVDQGGGPIWRVKDRNNYYVARWNPLENNFRVYYVKDGNRVQLDSADVTVSSVEWHTIRIEQDGNRITGYLDGKKLLEVTDSTLPNAGGVGFWTKADAASFFDDLVIQKK